MSDVLVVGGTGMLAGLTEALADQGHRVLVPSRHPERASERTVSFAADWSDPESLRDAIEERVEGTLDLAVIWCHRPYRSDVVDLIAPLMSSGGRVVEVLGSTALADLWDQRPTNGSIFVMLGNRQLDDGTSRWLTHEEISGGVLGALDRPSGSTVVVGSLD